MTPAKPTAGTELVEPLRQFLESFTQELTEQQFIPAFRGELGKLAEGLDNIQQSGETLQQIARGVDRLRDVFAPAGTRMLEGVKEIETQMRAGGDQMRLRAEEVLVQMGATHRELEQALRSEAGLLSDQNSASRENLSRISSDIDEQLKTFSSKLDSLCKKAEQEINQISQLTARVSELQTYAPQQQTEVTQVQAVYAPNTEEISQLLKGTESTVADELARHSIELREWMSTNTRDHSERLSKIDKTIDEALRTVAPKVQAELDTALGRLRDQMDSMVRVERELVQQQNQQHQQQQEHQQHQYDQQQHEQQQHAAPAVVDSSAFVSAISGTENRLLREFDDIRKSNVNELSEIQKALADLALDLAEITEKQTERVEKEQQNVKELMLKLERMSRERSTTVQTLSKQTGDFKLSLENIRGLTSQSTAQLSQQISSTSEQLSASGQQINALAEGEEARFGQLRNLLSRAEEQATKLVEQQSNEHRATRERIEAGVTELRSRWDGRFENIVQKSEEIAARMGAEFGTQIGSLRHDVEHQLHLMGEALRADLLRFDTLVREQNKLQESSGRDLTSEVSRAANLIDEKLTGFVSKSEENERFARAIETHVKVVATEVSALRSKQQESLEVMKEAIRANYDDNAARLKEVVDGGYDKFLDQVRTIPQALERYSKFVETMHQSNQLALQGIAGDATNLLTITSEMRSDNDSQKKFYPLLNKMLEKQSQMLEAVRRSQTDHDKNFTQSGKSVQDTREEVTKFLIDIKGEIRRVEGAEQTKLTELTQMHMNTYSELEKLQRNDLPAFRRDIVQLVQSKFEFIESTQAERQTALHSELFSKLEKQEMASKKSLKMLTGFVVLGVLVQIALHYNFLSFLLP